MTKEKIEEGDYIRCIYGDDSQLHGTVLWINDNIICVKSNDVLTYVNTLSKNLDLIEVVEKVNDNDRPAD